MYISFAFKILSCFMRTQNFFIKSKQLLFFIQINNKDVSKEHIINM